MFDAKLIRRRARGREAQTANATATNRCRDTHGTVSRVLLQRGAVYRLPMGPDQSDIKISL